MLGISIGQGFGVHTGITTHFYFGGEVLDT